MNTIDIINFARSFKTYWHTNNPYEIAKKLGIEVIHQQSGIKDFTAQTIKIDGYPTIISINDAYTPYSKKILCAHELGHALLHQNSVNHFAVTGNNAQTSLELEANLFAVALLTDENFDRLLVMPLERLNNYLLKVIMDYNLERT